MKRQRCNFCGKRRVCRDTRDDMETVPICKECDVKRSHD